jgi:hypothetical protein
MGQLELTPLAHSLLLRSSGHQLLPTLGDKGLLVTSPNPQENSTTTDLWIVHGKIDIPVHFPATERLYVNLGGNDIDGFVELRPLDPQRASTSVFWTASEPLAYEFRSGIRATDGGSALLRGMEFAEHLADRLTLLTGYPVRPLSVGFAYNETQLKDCIAGERAEYDWTTGGEQAFRTQPPKNGTLVQVLAPPEYALEAIRWFRHAMSLSRAPDQFLAYYIAIESIARHVPGVPRQPSTCTKCGEEFGAERWETAALRYLISRHPQLPTDAAKTLAKIRARIAHGSTDYETLDLASANLPALQRLSADGIALALGIDPNSFNFLGPSPVKLLAPIGDVNYSSEKNPTTDWGDLLSNKFAVFMSQHVTQKEGARDDPQASRP